MITSKKQLYELLSSVFPTRENGFSGAKTMPPMPYMNYYFSGDSNSPGDNKVQARTSGFRIELYSKSQTAGSDRKALEAAFNANDLFWIQTNESKLNEFDAVLSTYEISIYIKESEEDI